jgi:phosphatidylserine decarboxylase
MLIESMLTQVPVTKPYRKDPAGHPEMRDYKHMLTVMNYLLTSAPAWNHKDRVAGVVGLPFTAMFDWPMATSAGYSVFLDPTMNQYLKKILDAWGAFLQSPPSAAVLSANTSGWLGSEGKKDLESVANAAAGTNYTFEETFICDPNKENHGFASWDDFFTRLFRDGIRPVAAPDNDDVIANACESKPYRVAHAVKRIDNFWVKGQPYSIIDMLAHDPLAEQFMGGTVYQAFLSALSYHRWHAPVSGKVVKTYVVQGTYYSEPLLQGFENPDGGPDPSGEGASQAYLTEVATRAFIYIQADNPKIGLICVMPVGMVEVSTCDVTVKEGQHIKKGDQLGMVGFFYLNCVCSY